MLRITPTVRIFDDSNNFCLCRLRIFGTAMRQLVCMMLLMILCAQPAFAQIVAAPAVRSTKITCKAGRSASARLICADPDLMAVESILGIAYRDAKTAASPGVQQSLLQEQLTWIRERDQKCGLTGMDYKPIRELLPTKQCLEDAIEARIDELQDTSQTDSISSPSIAPPPPTIMMTPLVQAPGSSPPGSSTTNELPTFQDLHFTSAADGIGGIVKCSSPSSQLGDDPLANTPLSGKLIIKIAIDDNPTTYHMFENDTWGPFLDNLRNAAHSGCANALKAGRLRNASNERIDKLNDLFEVYSPQEIFLAYSTSIDSPWALQTNLPRARKQLKADLGIETWVEPSQLTKNPYFFKGSLVGMVVQFDHMLSANEAVFERAGSEIFVSGVSATQFQSKELVVLAGRVMGNKGVISPSGSEDLLPALTYAGARTCDNACAGLY
jgi:uncharacterized protein YecT (DUF1311 family)